MDPEYGLGVEILEEVEEKIIYLCTLYGLKPKMPPHDIAARVVLELTEGGKRGGS